MERKKVVRLTSEYLKSRGTLDLGREAIERMKIFWIYEIKGKDAYAVKNYTCQS